MLKHSAALLIFCLAAAGLLWSQSPAPALPAGPMREKVQTACTECHDAHIIVQQRLDRKLWTKEVDKMTKWGALVEPSDHDGFIDYLSANFGPNNSFVPRQNPPTQEDPGKGPNHKKTGR